MKTLNWRISYGVGVLCIIVAFLMVSIESWGLVLFNTTTAVLNFGFAYLNYDEED